MPIAVDWPEEMYTTQESLWSIVIGQNIYPVSELDLELVIPSAAVYSYLSFHCV
jgi:hypothetical protein